MAQFIDNGFLYDTEKADFICKVKKWYPLRSGFLSLYFGEVGRVYDCELYATKNGRYFLIREEDGYQYYDVINKTEASKLLSKFPEKYIEVFGAIPEA